MNKFNNLCFFLDIVEDFESVVNFITMLSAIVLKLHKKLYTETVSND